MLRRGLPADRAEGTALKELSAEPRIAVILPCYNEEAAIGSTVAGFRAVLPTADIYVYDNNSRDGTAAAARAAGAIRWKRLTGAAIASETRCSLAFWPSCSGAHSATFSRDIGCFLAGS